MFIAMLNVVMLSVAGLRVVAPSWAAELHGEYLINGFGYAISVTAVACAMTFSRTRFCQKALNLTVSIE